MYRAPTGGRTETSRDSMSFKLIELPLARVAPALAGLMVRS